MAPALVVVATLCACASARRGDADAPSAGSRADDRHFESGGAGSGHAARAGAGGNSSIAGTLSMDSAAGSSATDCRGPGVYDYGKGNLRKPCCTGYHEYFISSPGYDGTNHKSCFDGPDGGRYACVAGECGDGWCEDAESTSCGCAADCPEAAWEGTDTNIDPSPTNGFSEVPASCSKPDLLARLQTSSNAIDCGDLTYRASEAEQSAAVSCVRAAVAGVKPFQVFWETLGTDSRNPHGVVARVDGGLLTYFTLEVYDVNTFGLNLEGATATWSRCRLDLASDCTVSPEKCFGIVRLDGSHCDCLPQGKRPAAKDGEKVELRCKSQ